MLGSKREALKARERQALHAQCLSSSALLTSSRLAGQAALPLLSHALHFGVRPRGADVEAQLAGLALLGRLVDAHGVSVIESLHSSGGMRALVALMATADEPRVAMQAGRIVCTPTRDVDLMGLGKQVGASAMMHSRCALGWSCKL